MKHEIIVGNIGIVYVGESFVEARKHFNEYLEQSKSRYGRAGDEDVTWMRNSEIYKEFNPIKLEIADDDLRLDHIPDVAECRKLRREFVQAQFWPNVWHINDHGNVDLLAIGYNGAKIVESWVSALLR